uniref:Uncharacterized protein n=1 Tax=Anguilla anguilla TaxID=7936 RepID=A0A0E9T6R1_ANGAN
MSSLLNIKAFLEIKPFIPFILWHRRLYIVFGYYGSYKYTFIKANNSRLHTLPPAAFLRYLGSAIENRF